MLTDRIKSLLSGRDYLKHVLTLVTGSGVAQAIPIAVAPILTRLYSPEDFALLALYLSVASLFSVVATARYELAVLLPKSDVDAANIIVLSLLIAVGFTFVGLLIVLFWRDDIARVLRNPEIADWLFFIPITIFITGAYRTFSYWANRKSLYKRIAIVKVSQTCTASSVNVVGGLAGAGGSWMIVGQLSGQCMATGFLVLKMWSERGNKKVICKNRIIYNAKKYSDFPMVNTPHAFIDTIQSSGVVFVISVFFGEFVLGFYSLTMRILQAPLGLIGSSIGQVFYQRAARAYSEGCSIYSLLIGTTKRLVLLSAPFFIVFMGVAPDFFAFVFGVEWRVAGEYAQILIPWMALRFVVTPVSQVPIILGRQKAAFCFGISGNAIMLLSILYGGYVGDVKKGLILLSITMVIHLIVYFCWIIRISRKPSNLYIQY